jgi:hypothetical protein
MGGAHHPLLGVFGVMSAKNTVVNIMILTTFLSFLLYRRGNKGERVPMAEQSTASKVTLVVVAVVAILLMWRLDQPLADPTQTYHRLPLWILEILVIIAATGLAFANRGTVGQWLLFAMSAAIVVFYGVYGYFVEAIVRIGFSILQVSSVLLVLLFGTTIDIVIFRGARIVGEIRWGKIPERAQYVLFLLATSFTWLMGLMGYARAGLRTHWHIFNVMQDYSSDAFTPTLGFATWVISIIVLVFLLLVSFIFWLAHLGTQGHAEDEALLHQTAVRVFEPEPAAGGDGAD